MERSSMTDSVQMPVMETTNLSLRAFRPEDAPEVQRMAGSYFVADTTMAIPHPYDLAMAEGWIGSLPDEFRYKHCPTWAIASKSDLCLLGAISLLATEPGHQAELGYWIGQEHSGRGICTEAARAVVRFGFEEMDLRRIHARHLSRNPASGRVMEKLGMTMEGIRRSHASKWGKLEDVVLYGMLREDWRSSPGQ